MGDDWNIKTNKQLYQRVYYDSDINLLREKLIDDVFNFTDDITVVSRQVFIRQINKRFGVKE